MEKKNKIQWFDKLRLNSWEVEILIVGFVLVMLFNIPDLLNLEITKTSISLSPQDTGDFIIWVTRLTALFILKSIIYILIVSFSIYLSLRGFWVGVIGLSSVYPKGINLKKLNFNTIFDKQVSQHNFNDFAIKIDNICSSIFSFSFLISFSIVSLCLFFIEFVFLSSFFYNVIENSLVGDVITLIFGVFGVLFFIDYFLFGILKKIKWKPFGYFFNIIDKFYKHITFIFIYDTLYYAFISNVKRRIVFLLMVGFIILSTTFESLELNKPIYFPNLESSKNIMKFRNYEDKFKQKDYYDEHLYPRSPFIQSDVITENYLKLHIPYHPEINVPIENMCPEIAGIFLESDTSGINIIEKQERILNCINNSYSIFINKEHIESNFIFYDYAHPLLDIKSFFMFIPLDQYPNGRHTLKIDKILKDKFTSISFVSGEFEQEFGLDSELNIPFFISR